MMDINQASLLGVTNTGSKEQSDKPGSAKGTNKDMFMTLLVAQLKNQDPMSPQDGTAFVAQLAQFNSLEQLMNINDKLGKMLNINKALD
jgi:flagellar basal-body rod modification protein FlgD